MKLRPVVFTRNFKHVGGNKEWFRIGVCKEKQWREGNWLRRNLKLMDER